MIQINHIYEGDALSVLKTFPDEYINCCITSPPYWGLRNYQVEGQIGLEEIPGLYAQKLVEIFREVRRVLHDDGTLWLNIGDSYAGGGGASGIPEDWDSISTNNIDKYPTTDDPKRNAKKIGLKPKDLVGIPWMLAFALRADGWYLRSDIVWCLSGGTWIYVWSKKGQMPMMIRELRRLNPSTIKLWNGAKWTQLLGVSLSKRQGDEIELVLRSGERISCSKTHKFPTKRGKLSASDIRIGDIIESTTLPEPEHPKDCNLDKDAAWLAGCYLADGSKSQDCIQLSGNSADIDRWKKLQYIAKKYGGYSTISNNGNKQSIRLYGKILNAIISEFVGGKNAKNKHFSPAVWKYSNNFLSAMLDGYLLGDGFWEEKNKRWRLGFCRNYSLERDLRIVCARLGYHLILKLSYTKYKGKLVPIFRGEIRKKRSGHFNQHKNTEVIAIQKARCRELWNIGIKDEPHIYSLASGILSYNSKPNSMPESVTDRPTRSHEYIFLLSKNKHYYYDADSIREPHKIESIERACRARQSKKLDAHQYAHSRKNEYVGYENIIGKLERGELSHSCSPNGRNKRDVWHISTHPFSEAHFAVFPEKLIEPMVKAGCPEKGLVLDPFMGAGTTALVARKLYRNWIGIELNPKYIEIANKRIRNAMEQKGIYEFGGEKMIKKKYEGLKDEEPTEKIYNVKNGDELDEDDERLIDELKKEHSEEEDDWDD